MNKGNVQKCFDKSKLWHKYKETLGNFHKLNYKDIQNEDPLKKAKILEQYLEKDVNWFIAFKEDFEIRRFLMHLQHWYQATFRKKWYNRFLGLYHYVWPYLTLFPNWNFHVKFTKYWEGHFTVLVSHCFLHSHDPWITKNSCDTECQKRSSLEKDSLTSKKELPKGKRKIEAKREKNKTNSSQNSNKIAKQENILEDKNIQTYNINKGLKKDFVERFNHDFYIKYQNHNAIKGKIIIEILSSDEENNGNTSNNYTTYSSNTDRSNFELRDISNIPLNAQKSKTIYTCWPRIKLNSTIVNLWVVLYEKYVAKGTLSIPKRMIPKSQEKVGGNWCQSPFQSNFTKSMTSKREISYEEKVKQRILLQRLNASLNKHSQDINNFSALKTNLDSRFNSIQQSFIITLESDFKEVGLHIKLDNSKITDAVEGCIFLDTKIELEPYANTKTVAVYQLDNYGDIVLSSIFVFEQYSSENVLIMLSNFKEHFGTIKEISINLDEVFLKGIEEFIKNEKCELFIWDEALIFDTKDILIATNYANSEENCIKDIILKEGSEELEYWDKNEFLNFLNKISLEIEDLWNNYDKYIKFSKAISKEVYDKYQEWKCEENPTLNKEFFDALKIFLEAIPINSINLKNWISDIILLNPELVLSSFIYESEESKSIELELITNFDFKIISFIWKSYYPQIAHKIISNYLLSKIWQVEASPAFKIGSDFLHPVIIKMIKSDELKESNLSSILNFTYNSWATIIPQTLACWCKELNPWNIAWIHKMAYLLKGLKLDPEKLFESNIIIEDSYKVRNKSRLASLYKSVYKDQSSTINSSDISSLFELNTIVSKIWKSNSLSLPATKPPPEPEITPQSIVKSPVKEVKNCSSTASHPPKKLIPYNLFKITSHPKISRAPTMTPQQAQNLINELDYVLAVPFGVLKFNNS